VIFLFSEVSLDRIWETSIFLFRGHQELILGDKETETWSWWGIYICIGVEAEK